MSAVQAEPGFAYIPIGKGPPEAEKISGPSDHVGRVEAETRAATRNWYACSLGALGESPRQGIIPLRIPKAVQLTGVKPWLLSVVFPIMKALTRFLFAGAASLALFVGAANAAPTVGKPAPAFTLTDINGQKHSLADYKGKTVVLEWVNPECPFVVKHYQGSGNLPATQKAAVAEGAVWLLVNSGHPGAQGDYDTAAVKAWQQKTGAAATAYLRDQDGKVGKAYDARHTPTLFIIDPSGTLVYAGGIDSISTADAADIPKATNYVKAAFADMKAGRPVAKSTSKAYGCSVKY